MPVVEGITINSIKEGGSFADSIKKIDDNWKTLLKEDDRLKNMFLYNDLEDLCNLLTNKDNIGRFKAAVNQYKAENQSCLQQQHKYENWNGEGEQPAEPTLDKLAKLGDDLSVMINRLLDDLRLDEWTRDQVFNHVKDCIFKFADDEDSQDIAGDLAQRVKEVKCDNMRGISPIPPKEHRKYSRLKAFHDKCYPNRKASADIIEKLYQQILKDLDLYHKLLGKRNSLTRELLISETPTYDKNGMHVSVQDNKSDIIKARIEKVNASITFLLQRMAIFNYHIRKKVNYTRGLDSASGNRYQHMFFVVQAILQDCSYVETVLTEEMRESYEDKTITLEEAIDKSCASYKWGDELEQEMLSALKEQDDKILELSPVQQSTLCKPVHAVADTVYGLTPTLPSMASIFPSSLSLFGQTSKPENASKKDEGQRSSDDEITPSVEGEDMRRGAPGASS